MSQPSPELPSGRVIALTTLLAAVLAVVLLVTTILPAEYGIDPTGIGDVLGLTVMDESARVLEVADVVGGNEGVLQFEIPDTGDPVPLPNPEVYQGQAQPPRVETLTIEVPAESETEVKAVLRRGQVITYSWEAEGGRVYADFHGHPPGASSTFFVRYIEQEMGRGHNGSLVAPFDGEHGWYWVNYNSVPVTITLTLTGFHDDVVDYGIF